MKAVRPVIALNGIHFLQMRSVRSQSTQEGRWSPVQNIGSDLTICNSLMLRDLFNFMVA